MGDRGEKRVYGGLMAYCTPRVRTGFVLEEMEEVSPCFQVGEEPEGVGDVDPAVILEPGADGSIVRVSMKA
jgi:hypothetical protein